MNCFDIGEYQVVTKKGNFKAGDLGVYIQPDSVVPQTEPFKFIWEAYVGLDGTVPEKRRRITVRKFRGEWSEGLLLPIADFPVFVQDTVSFSQPVYVIRCPGTDTWLDYEQNVIKEGRDVSDLLGITHYDPDAGKELAADAETFTKNRRSIPALSRAGGTLSAPQAGHFDTKWLDSSTA